MKTLRLLLACAALSTLNLQLSTALAQGTAFTYQGVLSQGGAAINGSNDLTFTLYTAVSGGSIVGTSNVVNDLVMTNGLFTVTLDFGAGAFDGSARWLQIAGRPGASTGAYTNLVPRTPITPTPYAIYAGGANAANLVGTVADARLSANVALRAGGNAFTGNQIITGGNVGIGTIDPLTTLDVRSATPAITVGTTFGTSGALYFGNSGHGVKRAYNGINDVGLYTTAADVYLSANGTATSEFVLKNNGNVGIGTDAPARKLTVNAVYYGIEHTDGTVRLTTYVDPAGGWLGTASPHALNFFVGDGESSMTIALNGNVGVGTTYPSNLLDVAASGVIGNSTVIGANLHDVLNRGTKVSFGYNVPGSEFNGLRAVVNPGLNGCGNSGDLLFHTWECNTAPSREVMRINGRGNVGIGTINPITSIGYPGSGWDGLHTRGPSDNGLQIIQGVNSARLHLRADNNITNVAQDFIMANGADRIDFMWLGSGLANRLLAMTIATNGNVGIAGEVTTTAVNITSDRNAKEQFKPVNARDVLAKVVGLPISEWQYKTQSDARHIGPMAQDFHAAFAVGRDDKHITSVDADGVALAAIQGLNEKFDEQSQEKDTRIQELEKTVAELKELVSKLAGQQNGGAR